MSDSDSPSSKNSVPMNDFPTELPPEIALLLPDPHQREVATLTYRLVSDPAFRDDFYADPATALVDRGYSSDAETIDALHKMDRQVFDSMVQNWKDIANRSRAFKMTDPSSPQAFIALAAVALAFAFAAGAVATHYLAHHILEKKARKI